MHIPTSPNELSPDWLTSVLQAGGRINGKTTVSEVDIEPLGDDKGFFSDLSRLRLAYSPSGHDAPSTMIAKLSAASPEMRQRPNTIAAYAREVRFYQRIAGQTSLPTPICYYADVDLDTGFHVLLLEDLAPAINGSRVDGCTPDQAELIILEIARFHAYWWENSELHRLDWIEDPVFTHDELVKAHTGWWPEFLRQASHQLPDELIPLGERLGLYRAELFKKLWDTPPRTLTHADFTLDNMFFASPGGGRPFAVIDWQAVGRRRGAWDVGWFLTQNLEPDIRAAIETDLLELYVRTLADNGVQGYGFDQALHDYKLCLLHRFGSLISTIAAMPFSREQVQMHIDILLPRNAAAILHNDAASVLN